MSDRRRINGPPGATRPPTFVPSPDAAKVRHQRLRKPNELRKTFLQTGLVPSASGSAYLELEGTPGPKSALVPTSSTIKLSCAVHGPKPLPRTASFSPNLQLSASVKFAPFATRVRQGYVPNSIEKDLGLHLENALKGVLLPDRWPKSAIDVAVTVLEGEDDEDGDRFTGAALFNLLAAAINVAMTALVDAKIDCLDILAAGVSAVVPGADTKPVRILDPAAIEHEELLSSCVVGYLPSRDEVVEVWSSGGMSQQSEDGLIGYDDLVDSAIAAARGAQTVIQAVLLESVSSTQTASKKAVTRDNDIEMKT
ncbi:3'-5'-exoribonuclease [Cladophialophora chaetospira]|uniref:3'-5'-exoribonuclease n=1 Tax=Cladophialophora chaetospira TaxID=386627 RepID=A0AA38XGI2_9EURO|nr:3'-5'-exoribonuclease [Cladophialophora chaetospira]